MDFYLKNWIQGTYLGFWKVVLEPPSKKGQFSWPRGGSIPTFTVFESLDINENEEEAVQKSDWYKKSLNERVKLRGKAKNKSNKKKKKTKTYSYPKDSD